MINKLTIILLLNICLATGVFSQLNQSSVFYSLKYFADKFDYMNEEENRQIKSKLYSISIGYVFKGKYALSVNYIENNSAINNYFLPQNDRYMSCDFFYHFNIIHTNKTSNT